MSEFESYGCAATGQSLPRTGTRILLTSVGILIADMIRQADAVYILGGDQGSYLAVWRGTPVQTEVNNRLQTGNVTIGGSSAGMHVLSQIIYSGPGITSQQALNIPYHGNLVFTPDGTVGGGSRFLNLSDLSNIVTDTHFGNRDRMGRWLTFLARMRKAPLNTQVLATPRGIAVDAATALFIEPSGIGTVYRNSFNIPSEAVGYVYLAQPTQPSGALTAGNPFDFNGVEVWQLAEGQQFNIRAWTAVGPNANYNVSITNGVVSPNQYNGVVYPPE